MAFQARTYVFTHPGSTHFFLNTILKNTFDFYYVCLNFLILKTASFAEQSQKSHARLLFRKKIQKRRIVVTSQHRLFIRNEMNK